MDLLFRLDGEADENSFSKIADIDIDNRGQMLVLDVIEQRIRVYDHEGEYLRSFRGPGQGPGELTNARGLEVVGDTVYVLDNSIQVFHDDGTYIGVGTSGTPVPAMFYAIHATDLGLVAERRVNPGGSVGLGNWGDRTTTLYLVREGESPLLPVSAVNRVFGYATGFTAPAPLDVPEMLAVSRSHLFKVPTDSFRIDIYTVTGDRLMQVVSDLPRIGITRTDVEDEWNTWVHRVNTTPLWKEHLDMKTFERTFRAAKPAEYRQVIGRVLADRNGHLLIKRNDLSEHPYATAGSLGASQWLLLGWPLKPLGHISLPSAFTPMVFRDCVIAGVAYSEDDVPSVLSYRLQGQGPGGTFHCGN